MKFLLTKNVRLTEGQECCESGLPVYRDAEGGVGTPTSDNERTKIELQTTHLVVLINGYDGNEARVVENAKYIQSLNTHGVRNNV